MPADDPEQEPAELEDPAPALFPSFLLALFDETNVKILQAAAVEWKPVKEIAEESGVPRRACYRRVKDLYENGLLRLREHRPHRRGRPVKLYRSSLGNVQVQLTGTDYNVSLEWPEVRFDLSVQFP